MKRRSIFLLIGCVLVASLMANCAKPSTPSPTVSPKPSPAATQTPTPAASPSPTPTTPQSTPTAPVQTIELVHNNAWAPTHAQMGILAREWAKRIETATEGRVKLRIVDGGALIKAADVIDGLGSRIADTGSAVIAFTPSKLPLHSSISGMNDLKIGNKLNMKALLDIAFQLYDQFPEFKAEYQKLGVTPLMFVPSFAYYVSSSVPIKTVDDFKGKKIRTFGDIIPVLFQAAGAVPVTLAPSEAYTSLQTGVINGYVTDPGNAASMKYYEVAKYLTITGPDLGAFSGMAQVVYIGNNQSLARISAKDMDTIKKVSRETSDYAAELLHKDGIDSITALEKAGVTIIRLPQAEIDKWIAKSPDWYADGAKQLNSKGLPGTAWMNKYLEIVKPYTTK